VAFPFSDSFIIANYPRLLLDKGAECEFSYPQPEGEPMKPISNSEIRSLSEAKRRILIEHIDGPVPMNRENIYRIHTINSLMGAGLLRNALSGPAPALGRPRALVLTEDGRWAVSLLLADYAEALVRAGCLDAEPLTPLMILQRLKAIRKPAVPSPIEILTPAMTASKP
jgi:hypothetical protein